jgi:hypothetical protein
MMRNAHKIFVGSPELKSPLGRSSPRWENNGMMDLKEIGSHYVDRIHKAPDSAQWRAIVNFRSLKR